MRIAALYDIHANLPALEAVLEDVRRADVDAIVVGGDVLPGPMPRETLARLLSVELPVIAVFFGIIIRMFYREHGPEHFHAEHQGQHGKFDFDGNLIVGSITSKTALELIREWARLHRSELKRTGRR